MPPEKRKPEEEPEAAKSPAVSTHHEVTQPASAPPPSTTQATSSEVATGSPAKSGPYQRREIPARKRTKRGDGKKTEFEQGEELESGDGEEAKSNVQGTKAGAENKNSGGDEAKRSRKSTQHRSGDGEKTSANSSATDDVKFKFSANNDPSTKKRTCHPRHNIISKEFHPYLEWSADADADLPPLQWPLIDKEGNINMEEYEYLILPALKHLALGMYTENEAKKLLKDVMNDEMKLTLEDRHGSKLLELLVLDKHVRVFQANSAMQIFAPNFNWTVDRFIVNELSYVELLFE